MSSDDNGPGLAVSAAEQAHRYSGAVGIGEAADRVDVDHEICVVYCIEPRRKHRHLGCPSCYRQIAVRDIYSNEIEPVGTRFAWLAGAFLGGWAHAWREATVGMVRKPGVSSDGGLHRVFRAGDARHGPDHARRKMT